MRFSRVPHEGLEFLVVVRTMFAGAFCVLGSLGCVLMIVHKYLGIVFGWLVGWLAVGWRLVSPLVGRGWVDALIVRATEGLIAGPRNPRLAFLCLGLVGAGIDVRAFGGVRVLMLGVIFNWGWLLSRSSA